MTYEECGAILDEIADSLPPELYRELNGGIVLRDEARLHPTMSLRLTPQTGVLSSPMEQTPWRKLLIF